MIKKFPLLYGFVTKNCPGVSKRLASLGHTGRIRVVLGHTLNTQTLTKTGEQKKGFR